MADRGVGVATAPRRPGELTGRQKAAIVLLSLGRETGAQVLRHLSESRIEELTMEIASLRDIPPEVRDTVLTEFQQLLEARRHIARGGLERAREILERAVGPARADEIIRRLTSALQSRPFEFARKADPAQLFNFIQHEHPQTIALILAYLTPNQAAAILASLPPDRQVEVARRLATLDRTTPEVLAEVEGVLKDRLASFMTDDYTAAGGIEAAVEVLNRVDRSTEKLILEALEAEEPELAEEIRKRMLVFEDLVRLDDRALQRVIREIDSGVWALALKTASEEVTERVFRNMSRRAAEMLREDIEYLGPVRLRDVEEAQQKVVAVVRRLEEAGEIVITRGGGEELVV